MRYVDLVIKYVYLLILLIKNRPKSKQLVIKKIESKKTETAVFAIKTDRNRNRTGKSNCTGLIYRPFI